MEEVFPESTSLNCGEVLRINYSSNLNMVAYSLFISLVLLLASSRVSLVIYNWCKSFCRILVTERLGLCISQICECDGACDWPM